MMFREMEVCIFHTLDELKLFILGLLSQIFRFMIRHAFFSTAPESARNRYTLEISDEVQL